MTADAPSLAETLAHVAAQPVDGKRIKGLWVGATVATSLGRGSPGQVAMVTDGVNSVELAWNQSAGKWIEVGQAETAAYKTAATGTGGTSYAVNQQGLMIPFAAYLTLGLTLELRVLAYLSAGVSSTAFAAGMVATGNESGTQTTDNTHFTSEVSTTNTSLVYKASTWNALSGVSSADYICLNIGAKRSGLNNGSIGAGTSMQYRWTYTPS